MRVAAIGPKLSWLSERAALPEMRLQPIVEAKRSPANSAWVLEASSASAPLTETIRHAPPSLSA